jgi:multimeric flavodoxin WrbA
MSKVIGIVGSPRRNGNTANIVKKILEGATSLNFDTEIIYLSEMNFSACSGCEGCKNTFRCVVNDDMQKIYDLLDTSDGLVIGSPTYFYNVTSLTKAFLERLYCLDLFDPSDRSIWISKYEKTGLKTAAVIAVSEQNSAEDMGVTSQIMSKSLEAVGFRVIKSENYLNLYENTDFMKDDIILQSAYHIGINLAKTINLKLK